MIAISPSDAVQPDEDSAATGQHDFIYDAFISYSGFRKPGETSQVDVKIAERLHQALESYRVPRAFLKKSSDHPWRSRRLKKIFLDRDEVRVSSSLNDRLKEALAVSRFLIVICSPRARQSQWISQEIAIFRSLGRGEQILPLLVEGEPAEAFPNGILQVKSENELATTEIRGARQELLALPLAADVRASSLSKSLRLLKHEKLRLLAAMLGCEYDDLRRREQERFFKRAMSAGAAMLVLVLILTTLSIQLFFAQQKASRNAQLALDASAAVLPLIAPETNAAVGPSDAVLKEVHVKTAITYLEMLRGDDPENLKCLITLRALYGTIAELLRNRNRKTEAQEAYQKADSMVIPIALSRLRSWKPTRARSMKEISSSEALSFPNNYDLNRLRSLLAIAEQLNGTANIKNALDYVEFGAEYLLLLDTSTREGKVEARRILQSSLSRFQQAQSQATLTQQQEELVAAITQALVRLTNDDD